MGRNFRFRSSEGFICRRCKRDVPAESYGTRQRNHCPACLWSLHVDETPGDRRCPCHSLMEPIGVWVKRDGEWAIIHRCTACGALRANRIAGDDSPWAMMSLAAKPLSQPPFPLEGI
jgi:ribosome biogenesis GTPase